MSVFEKSTFAIAKVTVSESLKIIWYAEFQSLPTSLDFISEKIVKSIGSSYELIAVVADKKPSVTKRHFTIK